MVAEVKSEVVEWSLTDQPELAKFRILAAQHGIHILDSGKPHPERPIRLQVERPGNEASYMAFALAVRPHHQSDS